MEPEPVTYSELDQALGQLIAAGIDWPRCGLARTGLATRRLPIAHQQIQTPI